MKTLDDLISELFHLQDYELGDKPVKVLVGDKELNIKTVEVGLKQSTQEVERVIIKV